MAARGRDVLIGKLYYRTKKGNGSLKKKKVVGAFAGVGGSNIVGGGDSTAKCIPAQIMIFEDYEKVEKPGYKPKNIIKLDGAKIESSYSSPSASNTSSPAYGSATITSPPGSSGTRLSASPSTPLQNGVGGTGELYGFTVTTSLGDVHEFKIESENDRLRWVKILQLLVMYPYSPIPEEPKTNPIKDSFRNSLEAKNYNADSVWPVYILPEEVGSKKGILGLHILVLRSGIPNVSMGQLDIISPSDHSRPVVSWDRDKMRRTGKTGHLVFIEIGRRCEGGPGLVWMYTGYHNDAQALRETLHKFLFHGDGRAIAMDSQAPTMYDVPRSSVDAQPHSINKRSSIPSGYHNHLLQRSRSQDHGDSGYNSMGSGRTPPTLDSSAPPLRLDKHPSIRRKRDSDTGMGRRGSGSVQSPCGSFTDREASDQAFFECDEVGGVAPRGSLSRCTSHTSSDSPPESEGYITGHMDGDSESTSTSGTGSIISTVAGGHHYDLVRTRGAVAVAPAEGHPHYTPQAPVVMDRQNGEEYMRMIHPKTRGDEYVYMKPTGGANSVSPPTAIAGKSQSQSIPVPMPQQQQQQYQQSEYNTLQHFRDAHAVTSQQQRNTASAQQQSYETLPPIAEQSNANHPHHRLRRENYENHPMPQDLKGVVPRAYCPNYENRHESDFRGRRGSHGQDSYENVGGVGGRGAPSPTSSNKPSSSPQPILVNSNR